MIITKSVYILLKIISNQKLIEDVMVVGVYNTKELAEEDQIQRENEDQINDIENIKYDIQFGWMYDEK